ncbi:hypothetical protein [Saccharothrix yanglingensis]|uniref:Excreted virulence factor EspC (Type VII ESX diderm) n=1 Tax=Saccharothrix yanglingensis TaxID=659496 RepID=A0ABU0XA90_9PSEU|nr:hypothetical protein [Saccharothrix yanglingensis]MDQ2589061.1 hypothetical protein [Saccharothrix yanglingensis]
MGAVNDRLTVDTDLLKSGGVYIDRIAQLARSIAGDLEQATEMYRNAGGTSELGEKFDQNYVPMAQQAAGFLVLLEETIGGAGERTVDTARSFADAADEADAVTSKK